MKFNLGDRVVITSYGNCDPETTDVENIIGQAGTVIDLPYTEGDWYDVRLDNPVLEVNDWLCEEGELSAEDNNAQG